MAALLNGADSIDAATLPPGLDWYAGYVGGRWPSESAIVARFPHAKHKSIAVNATEDADILDCENGDAIPAQCPDWLRRQHARGLKRPGIYTFFFEMRDEVIPVLHASGLPRDSYVLWVAHWNGVKALELGCEAKQWGDPAFTHGQWDGNVADPSFFDGTTVPVLNKRHYERFDGRKRLLFGKLRTERHAVELYDKLRAMQTPNSHPHRAQLNFVRKVLRWEADRVWTVAHRKDHLRKNGRPGWGIDHLGWRFQELHHRAQGQLVA
jgi:hypothetical protein